MNVPNDFEARVEAARANPQNIGALADADGVGTVGSPDCGDMLRMWVKFTERPDGRRVIDRATFQSFGCQTAVAVASVATELLRGKTADEALAMSPAELSAPLGALPPMKIHCAQLVEGALKQALTGSDPIPAPAPLPAAGASAPTAAPTLYDQLVAGIQAAPKKLKITLHPPA